MDNVFSVSLHLILKFLLTPLISCQPCLKIYEGAFRASVRIFSNFCPKILGKEENCTYMWSELQEPGSEYGQCGTILPVLEELKAQLRVEHAYYKMTDNMQTFSQMEGFYARWREMDI